MGVLADVRALSVQATARWTVRYGDHLRFVDPATVPAQVEQQVPTRHGMVRCVLQPAAASASPPPLYVHLHGGAFITRYPEMDQFFAHVVAAEVGATVLSVDYDVAPRHRYPVAHEQVQDVVCWASRHGDALGVDASRLAVGGFSAGGNLAAAACLALRPTTDVTAQLLVVPSLDVAGPVEDKRSPLQRPIVSPALVRLVRDTYFRDTSRRSEPGASPLLAPDLEGLPPTMVVTGELDALRAEGDAYAARMRDAGVEVGHLVVSRRDHYVMDGLADRRQARWVLDQVVGFLRSRLGTSTTGRG